jgi:hypothetical protein
MLRTQPLAPSTWHAAPIRIVLQFLEVLVMKRYATWFALLVLALVVAPVLRADVKTREKSSTKFEGLMGRFIGMMAGACRAWAPTTGRSSI